MSFEWTGTKRVAAQALFFVLVAGTVIRVHAITASAAPAVQLELEVTVTGRMSVPEGVPLPLPSISIMQAGRTIQTAAIQRDGNFQLSLPQGEYTVTVSSLPSDYVLQSIRHGSVDLKTNPLKLSGPLPQEIQLVVGITVPAAWVRVSGSVTGANKLPTFGTNYAILDRGLSVEPFRARIGMDGSFDFPKVLPGSYIVRVTDPGGTAIAQVPTVDVRVTAGNDITGLVLSAQAMVPITARVQVEGQAPLPYVSLFFAGTAGRFFSSDIGNSDGVLKAEVLPGEYRVRVGTVSEGYAVTTVTKESVDVLADVLKVEPNSPLELVITVRTSTTGVNVRGRIVRASDSDPAPGRVTISKPVSFSLVMPLLPGPRALTTQVRPDGSFEFANVIPGSYIVDVEFDPAVRGDHLMTMLHEPQPILVGAAGAADVEIRTSRQVQLQGRIVVEDGGPMPRPSIDAEFVTIAPSVRYGLSGYIPNLDGTFQMILPEGGYRFTVRSLPPGYHVKSMLQAGREVLNQPFNLSPDSRELVVLIGTIAPFRKVRGRVVDAPNAGSTSSVSATLRAGLTEIQTTVGPEGRFEFLKVPLGTYTVSVDKPGGSMSPVRVAIGDGPPGEPRITVADKDVEDVRIIDNVPVQAFVGTGRVIVEGDGPMPRFGLTFNGGGGSVDPSPVDGVFRTWMPVGSSRVRLSELPKEYVLRSMTYGDINLLEKDLVLRASDASANNLRIVVAPSGTSPWKRVAGRLTGFDNLGTEQVRIRLASLRQNVEAPLARDGSFEFPKMLSGTYSASIRIGNSASDAGVGLRAQVVVAEQNIPALEIVSPRKLTVELVTDAGTPAADTLHLWVARRDSDGRWLDYQSVDGSAQRYFTAGDRLEIQRVPFGYRVKTLTYGSIDLLSETLQFNDASVDRISIVLESVPPDLLKPEFTLKGKVKSASTIPSGTRATATYVQRVHASVMNTMMETLVREDGSFQFDRLLPGPYEIRIVGRPEVSRAIVPVEDAAGVTLSIP